MEDQYDYWYKQGYEDGLTGTKNRGDVPPEYEDSYVDGHEDGAFKRWAETQDAIA